MVYHSYRDGFGTNNMFSALTADFNLYMKDETSKLRLYDSKELKCILPGIEKTIRDMTSLCESYLNNNQYPNLVDKLSYMLALLTTRREFITVRIEFIDLIANQFPNEYSVTEHGPCLNGKPLGS